MNSRIFYSLIHKFFRKSGFIRRYTIAQNKFWTNVCRLSHSRRKGHWLTPKQCLDWWCNAPFFCGYAKRCFYGFSDDFSFFVVHLCRKRNICRVRQLAPWMKQAATHSRANREERMLPPGGTSAIGSETFILPCRWFALFTLPMISFSFSRSLFLRISPEVFVFQSASVFVYLHLAPFSRAASVSHFRSGRKGNSGIWRESKVTPPVFGKNLQPFG